MAQLSRLAQLFHKISNNLTEKDVRDLRSLLATDEILGKAQVENATPLEMFNMLVDMKTIGKGDLGFLVQVLRSLGKTRLADEAQHLAEEQKNEESKLQHMTDDSEEEFHSLSETEDTWPEDWEQGDGGSEDTEVKEPISVPEATGVSSATGNKQITGVTDAQQVISGLASLHIKDWQRMLEERTGEYPSAWPVSSPPLPEDEHDIKVRLETLLAELDTPAAMADRAQQADLHCQIGDLYRTRLNNIESALLYYQNMLECSKSLSVTKQAQAHNRLGLTYDMLGKHEEALENHQRLLVICKDVVGNAANICVAYKNLASSIALLGQVSDAKANYESALVSAEEAGNKTEQMDICFRLGDLLMGQLGEVKASEMYFKKMLTLAVDWGSTYFELLAYNRLGSVHDKMGQYEASLEWHKKSLNGNTEQIITAHQNIADSYKKLGKLDLARSHYQSAMTIAKETGNKQKQMDIYHCLGDLHREQLHEPQESHKYYTEMLALAKDLGRKDKERLAYNRLGAACHAMQDNEAALEWSQKSLKTSQEGGDKTEQITAHQNIARSYKALGKPDQARYDYQSALDLAVETGNKQEQMDIYHCLGDLHREQLHEPQESHKYYTEMLALAKDLGRKDKEGLAYNRLGAACGDMQDNEAALEWHQKSLKIRQEDGDKTEQITAHKNIAASYQALGKPDQARSHYQSAMDIAMETGNKQQQEDITEKLASL